jgi:hypothetical protein
MMPEYSRDPGVDKLFATLSPPIFSAPVANDPYIDIDNLRARPNDASMTDLTRHEVDAKLAAAEARGEARTAKFELDIKSGFADLRTEFAQVRAEMANDRAASTKQSNESQRFIITAVFAMISIAVAVIGAMINFSKGDKPASVPPAPIVIYAPPAATAAPQPATPAASAKQ